MEKKNVTGTKFRTGSGKTNCDRYLKKKKFNELKVSHLGRY